MKWADYGITKISFDQYGKVSHVVVREDLINTFGPGELKDQLWLRMQIHYGKTFCCITRKSDGKWHKSSNFTLNYTGFVWQGTLPHVLPKRKTFVSYYHNDDEVYRTQFDSLFKDLVTTKSVAAGDIASDNSDEYIKQLIQKDYLADTSILVVLIGAKTKCRKHVDWEISGALHYKVGNCYAGLLGILLPTHPDFGRSEYLYSNIPLRLAENVKSSYATVINWTEDRAIMQTYVESAFGKRVHTNRIINKELIQMVRNTCS